MQYGVMNDSVVLSVSVVQSHAVCGTLPRQPKETNTLPRRVLSTEAPVIFRSADLIVSPGPQGSQDRVQPALSLPSAQLPPATPSLTLCNPLTVVLKWGLSKLIRQRMSAESFLKISQFRISQVKK